MAALATGTKFNCWQLPWAVQVVLANLFSLGEMRHEHLSRHMVAVSTSMNQLPCQSTRVCPSPLGDIYRQQMLGGQQAEDYMPHAEQVAEASVQVRPVAVTWALMGWLPPRTSSLPRPEKEP